MKSIEQMLFDLEKEDVALNVAAGRVASTMPIYNYSKAYASVRNEVSFTSVYGNSSSNDPERIIVTLNTDSGAQTIAKLEVNVINPSPNGTWPIIRRVPYSGGARWILSITAQVNENYNWVSTNLELSVLSMVPGFLSIKEVES